MPSHRSESPRWAGPLAVFGAYDDSPGGTLMGFALVLGAMAFSARSAWRSQ